MDCRARREPPMRVARAGARRREPGHRTGRVLSLLACTLFAISPEGHGAKRDAEAHHYPFPGGPNPLTTLRIASVGAEANARDVSLDFGDGYLARVVPHPLGGWLVASLPRDQLSLHWWFLPA